jgi:hypothetical protein
MSRPWTEVVEYLWTALLVDSLPPTCSMESALIIAGTSTTAGGGGGGAKGESTLLFPLPNWDETPLVMVPWKACTEDGAEYFLKIVT